MGSIFSAALERTAARLDRWLGWDRLPLPLAIPTLVGLRGRLRNENLYDTGKGRRAAEPDKDSGNYLTARTYDGTYNDLNDPQMGALHARFGRNVPLQFTWPEPDEALLEPNPRLVSRRLLTRDEFSPATTLNLLAGAWIQFEVHDWFSHGQGEEESPWRLPLEDGDPWHENPMQIPRAKRDPSPDSSGPPTYATEDTHWWDGSKSTAATSGSPTRSARARTGS